MAARTGRADEARLHPWAAVVVAVVTLGLALAIVTLDGQPVLTLTDVMQAVLWTASYIVTWRMMWGPRR